MQLLATRSLKKIGSQNGFRVEPMEDAFGAPGAATA
jgi:hypothetical protein